MVWTSKDDPKCPVSPADRGEFMEPKQKSADERFADSIREANAHKRAEADPAEASTAQEKSR